MKKTILVLSFLLLSTNIFAQGSGTPSTLRVRIDATGALVISASAIPTAPYASIIFNSARLKVDSSGNLVTSCADCVGGTPGGSNTYVQFNDSSTFGGDSTFTFNKTTDILGFNFANMPNTVQATQTGIMYKANTVWMHNFNYGTVTGPITTIGHNTFLGENAGLPTGGAGVPTITTDGSENTGIGYQALRKVTIGHRNTCVGSITCQEITTSNYNSSLGYSSLRDNTTGNNNNAFGYISLSVNTTGSDSACFGHASCALVVAARNTGMGAEAEGGNESGTDRVSVGYRAGKYMTADSDRCKVGNFSMYFGSQSRCSSASTRDYEYVFGAGVSGSGSYNYTLGNSKSSIQYSLSDAPTCATNCGTSPTLTGNNSSFTLTIGASGIPASGFVVTFDTDGAFTAAPQCTGSMGKSGMLITALPMILVTSSTTLTVTTNGTAPANGDIYHFICMLGK